MFSGNKTECRCGVSCVGELFIKDGSELEMGNFKVKVNSEAESKEAQDLLVKMGYHARKNWTQRNPIHESIQAWSDGEFTFSLNHNQVPVGFKELTLPELRDMVVLKRNDIGDATHVGKSGSEYYLGDKSYFWDGVKWDQRDFSNLEHLKPIEKKEMKEYLNKETYAYVKTCDLVSKDSNWIEIPKGMNFAYKDEFNVHFTKLEMGYRDSVLVWQRSPSLNNQYAEIKQVRQASKDNVNNPQHYNKGGVECIDAIEASMTHEAFKGYLKGNVQKYMWRYEQKGGVESLRKAQWYLERLVASMDS